VNAETLELPKGSGLNVWIKQAPDWTKRLVYQGSNDPAVERLVSFIRERGGDMILRSVGSLGGLAAISRGEGHIASCHLIDPEDGSYNDRYIFTFPDSGRWKRIRLFSREQGFIVQRGNPKAIKSASDLTAEKVVFLNRQPGAGTRVLFDYLLEEANINPERIKGYHNIAITHFESSARVFNGSADVALGIRAAAEAFGNDFIPVTEEQFELVIPDRFETHPGMPYLMDAISCKEWRSRVKSLGGYSWLD